MQLQMFQECASVDCRDELCCLISVILNPDSSQNRAAQNNTLGPKVVLNSEKCEMTKTKQQIPLVPNYNLI